MEAPLVTFICVCALAGFVLSNVAPVSQSATSISALESAKVGTIIGKLTVVDPDGPEKLVLKTKGNDTSSLVRLGPLSVSNKQVSADIILKSELDRDFHSPTHKLHFTAFDGEATKDITVTLQVLDVNDNAPQFTQDVYRASVSSMAPIGSVVLIVTAIDPDVTYGGVVHYSIKTDDLFAYQAFEVNQFAGLITVKSPLVIKRGSDLNLQVVATDGGGLSSTANVTVSVI